MGLWGALPECDCKVAMGSWITKSTASRIRSSRPLKTTELHICLTKLLLKQILSDEFLGLPSFFILFFVVLNK